MTNAITITRTLLYVLWKERLHQLQSGTAIPCHDPTILKCLTSAHWHSDSSIPTDPLVLAHVFASLCYLLPPLVVQENAADVRELMDMLVDLIDGTGEDMGKVNETGTSQRVAYSRRECLGWTIRYFSYLGLKSGPLLPKLKEIEKGLA